MDKLTILLVVGVGILVLLCILCVNILNGPSSAPENSQSSQTPISQPSPPPQQPLPQQRPTLRFFHADWCPHCQSMKEDWAQVKQTISNHLNVEEIEHKQLDRQKYPEVTRFPMIILYLPNGKSVIHEGEKKAQTILQFIKDNLQ